MRTTALSAAPVLHSEWIKIRSVRASLGSLLSVPLVTTGITLLTFAAVGRAEAEKLGVDPVSGAFYAVNFGQIAAMAFGATALSSEFHNGALRTSLTAVPDRTRFFLSKIAVIGASGLVAGLVASVSSFLGSQAFMGSSAIGPGHPGALRAVLGCGVYLALMALFAAGLTALLRSAVAVLSILIPFILIVSFVVGDIAGGAAEFLPDRAGQLVLQQAPQGSLGPWAGLGVLGLWTAAALVAGWFVVRRRDA